MKEKDAMVQVGKELFDLCESEKIDKLAFRKKALEFVKHLSNIGGFCDGRTQSKIWIIVRQLTALIIDPNDLFAKTNVKIWIPLAIGIQVDFTKRPFRALSLDLNVFGAGVKGTVKR